MGPAGLVVAGGGGGVLLSLLFLLLLLLSLSLFVHVSFNIALFLLLTFFYNIYFVSFPSTMNLFPLYHSLRLRATTTRASGCDAGEAYRNHSYTRRRGRANRRHGLTDDTRAQ